MKDFPDNTGLPNYRARVGIDPKGGEDPFADSVVWGEWATSYNVYHELPAVEAEAEAAQVTVFTEHLFQWPFKHNDAYYDHATFEPVHGGSRAACSMHGPMS